MFLLHDTVIYSATDLTNAAKCEWALMRALDAKLGRVDPVDEEDDPMLARAAVLGDVHERRTLDELRKTREVVEFERPEKTELAQAAAESERALRAGADALFQATFFDGRFLGYADFILRGEDGAYEVYDTKLARSAKITALLQLAAYSDQLERLGIPIGEHVHLLLGDGRTSTHRIRDILPVFRRRRARLQHQFDERLAEGVATEWGDPRYTVCGRCAACKQQVELHRDVLQVAGMRMSQRKHLTDAGVTTIDALASSTEPVAGMAETTLAGLRAQARLQTQDGLPYEVFNPLALGALPEPNEGDIFFDFEGDPLYSEQTGPEWGLDYLFGLVERDETFRAFWAHDYAEERQALLDFLAYVRDRRQKYPGMHIYHYAAYERVHLLSIAARHGVAEEEVDELLRAHLLVDLYPIVKKSMRVGSHSYSLKKLEPLYMGDEHREGVDNAADSITEYAESRRLFRNGALAEAQAKLDDIGRYNRYDCVSTLRLRDWLLARAEENNVPPASAPDVELLMPTLRDPSDVYLELDARVKTIQHADRTTDDTALALASAAIDYHRREGKKFWQEHFDRLRAPVDEWADVRDVLVIDGSVTRVERDWQRENERSAPSRLLRVTGTVAPGSSLKADDRPFVLYDEPYPPGDENREPGSRYAHNRARIVAVEGPEYLIEEKLSRSGEPYDQLPIALAPSPPPNPGSQVGAIAQWGRGVLDALPGMMPDPAMDILRRLPPRAVPGAVVPVPVAEEGGEVIAAIRDSLLRLDRSYIAVQGPPGTGKTYTGSRVIADLVLNHGWRVGVVAQSHETVKNMLKAIVDAGLDPSRIGKRPKEGDNQEVPWTNLDISSVANWITEPGGRVLGGTAWNFSNPGQVPRRSLDLLVIDEAGQFSLASTIAASMGAQRLLLLGDPQQLPQVSQASHPEPVDESALGWLSDGHDVLPPELGYFLAASWRMHPAVCEPVSRLSYEGQLRSVAGYRHLEGVEPGLHVLPVPHELNATSSPEEADRVVEIARSLVGRAWSIDGATAPLPQEGIIVVAPYNAQVELIRERLAAAGLPEVSVGTVDRFQGREAAVAIVSLAASSADEVPRGIEFLLLQNRLNVAISRAQFAAYLLYSPALTDYLPRNPMALSQLSAFLELVGEADPIDPAPASVAAGRAGSAGDTDAFGPASVPEQRSAAALSR
ncbi:TM0106 family RecB-like putative nuclease [Planctomonas deserti]|uniref:TM0106 family RecB-like putative nuclease n=1 Tax=Planctomonas deserti TaxID=2144185 RepID=UPI000D3830C8|nr:bifunctional RecB family nuclease/DEAD/DEAH box helicase [Planctomonas deserti]